MRGPRILTLAALIGVFLGVAPSQVNGAGVRTLTIDFRCRAFSFASTERVQRVPCAGRPWDRFKADVDGTTSYYRHKFMIGRARAYMRLHLVYDSMTEVHGTWRFTKGTRRLSGIRGTGTFRGTFGGVREHFFFSGSATVPRR